MFFILHKSSSESPMLESLLPKEVVWLGRFSETPSPNGYKILRTEPLSRPGSLSFLLLPLRPPPFMELKQLMPAMVLSLLLLSQTAASAGKGEDPTAYCQLKSSTFPGVCVTTSKCSIECRDKENAQFGRCHFKFGRVGCFCYYPRGVACKNQ